MTKADVANLPVPVPRGSDVDTHDEAHDVVHDHLKKLAVHHGEDGEHQPGSGGTGFGVNATDNEIANLVGDYSTNTTAQFDALMAGLWALAPTRFTVYFPYGGYVLDPYRVWAWNVELQSETQYGATLISAGTTPGTLLVPRGCFSSLRAFIIDNRAENIALPNLNMDNHVGIQPSPAPSVSGGGTAIAGGLVLSAGVSPGATSITVTKPYSGPTVGDAWYQRTPIMPGSVINICQSGNYQRVRVSKSFAMNNTSGIGGGCLVPIEGQILHTFTTAANVSLCLTGVEVTDNIFLGSGVQGVCMYECRTNRNRFLDQIDCAIGHFDRGNAFNQWNDNEVQTKSYWAWFMDDVAQSDNIFPPNEHNQVVNPNFSFGRGGPDVGTGLGTGNIELIGIGGGKYTLIKGGVLDFSKANGSNLHGGIRLNPLAYGTEIEGTHIKGGNQTNAYGVLVVTLSVTDPNTDTRVRDVVVENSYGGIDLGQSTSSLVTGCVMRGISNKAISQTYGRSDAAIALHTIDNNDLEGTGGSSSGIYLNSGLTVPAGSGYRGENTIRNFGSDEILAPNYTHKLGSGSSAGRSVADLKLDFGAVGDGVANDTAKITAAFTELDPGDSLWVPEGVYLTDPQPRGQQLQLQGAGRFSSWFKSRVTHTDPLLSFELPGSPPFGAGVLRGYYGTTIEGIGLDLSTGGLGSNGLRLSSDTHWVTVRDFFVKGPSGSHTGVAVDNRGFNSFFEDMVLFDCGRFFYIDGDTGLELTMRDIAMGRNSAGVTTLGIEVALDSASGIKGALMMENVRLSNAIGVSGLVAGMKMTAPGLVSVPLFARGVILDNVGGVGLEFVNIRDVDFSHGWINSAGGGSCVKITGGGNLRFLSNDYRGLAKTYEFVGGSTEGFVSKGNYCPTNIVYLFPGSNKPTKMDVDDLVWTTAPMDVSNDMPGLKAALAPKLGTRWHGDATKMGATGAGKSFVRHGTATLTNGSTGPISDSTINNSDHYIVIVRAVLVSGTAGELGYTIINGTSFTLTSTTSENSTVDYEIWKRE